MGVCPVLNCCYVVDDLPGAEYVDYLRLVQMTQDDPQLRRVRRALRKDWKPRGYTGNLRRFKPHHRQLRVKDCVVVREGGKSTQYVVPFTEIVKIVIRLHVEYLHAGRDKLLQLASAGVWHPFMYKIAADVAITCPICQVDKSSGTMYVPPTLKISTSRPFELVAVD